MTSSSKVLISPAPIRTSVGGKDRGDPQNLAIPDVGRAGQFVIVVVQVGHIPVNVQPAFQFGGREVGPLAGVIRSRPLFHGAAACPVGRVFRRPGAPLQAPRQRTQGSAFIVHCEGGVQVEIGWSSDEDCKLFMNNL